MRNNEINNFNKQLNHTISKKDKTISNFVIKKNNNNEFIDTNTAQIHTNNQYKYESNDKKTYNKN
jgi:hypothetical protein